MTPFNDTCDDYYSLESHIVSLCIEDIRAVFQNYSCYGVGVIQISPNTLRFVLEESRAFTLRDKMSDQIYDLLYNKKNEILKDYYKNPDKYPWYTPQDIEMLKEGESRELIGYTRVVNPSDIDLHFENKKKRWPDDQMMLDYIEKEKELSRFPIDIYLVQEDSSIEKQIQDYATKQMAKKNMFYISTQDQEVKTSAPDINAPFVHCNIQINKVLSSFKSSKDSSFTTSSS